MQPAEPYTVEAEGFILGDFHEQGATVHLTDRQAHTFVLEGRVARQTVEIEGDGAGMALAEIGDVVEEIEGVGIEGEMVEAEVPATRARKPKAD